MFSVVNNNNNGFAQDNQRHKPSSREWQNIEILQAIKQGDFSHAKDFSGWGGLANALRNTEVQQALSQILSDAERKSLYNSVSSAYFTPKNIVKYCWQLAEKLGFQGGKILEPACGVGGFFEEMPKTIADNSGMTGLELDKITAQIAAKLYPEVNVIEFDYTTFNAKGYDLIISNPPFSKTGITDQIYSDLNGLKAHHVFLARSMRLLRDGGLCIFVVPSYCLDSPTNHPRNIIAKEAELIFAARLPDNIFTGATVTTDIVVFKKQAHPNNDYLSITQVQLACGYRDMLSDYYIAHPEHILGNLKKYEFLLRKENRMRRGLKVVGSMAEVDKRLPALIDQLQPCYKAIRSVDDNVFTLPNKTVNNGNQLADIAKQLEMLAAKLKAIGQSQWAA